MTTTTTYRMWQRLSDRPGGSRLFSAPAMARVPYFASVLPHVRHMEPGLAEVDVPKWLFVKSVEFLPPRLVEDFNELRDCGRAAQAFWGAVNPAGQAGLSAGFGEWIAAIDQDGWRADETVSGSLLGSFDPAILDLRVGASAPGQRLGEPVLRGGPVRASIEVQQDDVHMTHDAASGAAIPG